MHHIALQSLVRAVSCSTQDAVTHPWKNKQQQQTMRQWLYSCGIFHEDSSIVDKYIKTHIGNHDVSLDKLIKWQLTFLCELQSNLLYQVIFNRNLFLLTYFCGYNHCRNTPDKISDSVSKVNSTANLQSYTQLARVLVE